MPGEKWGEGPKREVVDLAALKRELAKEQDVDPVDREGFHDIAAMKKEVGIEPPVSVVDDTQMHDLAELRRLAHEAAEKGKE